MEKNASGGKCFFAAANSGYGFYSFYGDIFEEGGITERFIIKGGPGTGKSRFMKEVAYRAQMKDYEVETYACSSDPSSLDGVTVNMKNGKRLCVLDGTAPHVCEASLPGARDTIINFCDFWDSARLREQRREIIELGEKKARGYYSASDSIRSALLIQRETEKATSEAVDREKIASFLKRYLSSKDRSEEYFERIGLASSFGMFGEYNLKTYSALADRLVVIDNSLRNASAFLEEALRLARGNGISSYRSYNFLDPHRLDAVFLCGMGLCFISSDLLSEEEERDGISHVGMQRFTDKATARAQKECIKRTDNLKKEIFKNALADMKRMQAAHFELERIYAESMDFSKKEEFTSEWLAKHL